MSNTLKERVKCHRQRRSVNRPRGTFHCLRRCAAPVSMVTPCVTYAIMFTLVRAVVYVSAADVALCHASVVVCCRRYQQDEAINFLQKRIAVLGSDVELARTQLQATSNKLETTNRLLTNVSIVRNYRWVN